MSPKRFFSTALMLGIIAASVVTILSKSVTPSFANDSGPTGNSAGQNAGGGGGQSN